MKKILLTLTLTLTSLLGFSQYTIHSVDDCLQLAEINTTNGTYTASVVNPSTTGNAAINVSQIEPNATSAAGRGHFALPYSIGVTETVTFSIKLYSETAGSNNVGSGIARVRLYNSALGFSGGNSFTVATYDKVGSAWQSESITVTLNDVSTIAANGGYDSMAIQGFLNSEAADRETLYFDDMEFDIAPTTIADAATLETGNTWMYHGALQPVINYTVSGGATVEEGIATPTTSGNNSPTVLKITRGDDNANSGMKFIGGDFDYTAGNLTFRIYPECNLAVGSNVRIRMRKDSDNVTQQSYAVTPLVGNQWNEVTVDLTSGTGSSTTPDNLYNELVFLFNQGDSSADSNGTIFYVDAVQTPEQNPLSTESFELTNNVKLLANPVRNTLQLSKSPDSATVYSITGQQVLKWNSIQEGYDVSTLKSGLYLIEVTYGSASKVFKFIKE